MKKMVCVLMAVVLSLGMVSVATAEEPKELSEMTDEDCIAFVHTYDIKIPQWYENDIEWAPFIRKVISMVEENPNVSFGFGHTDLLDFAEAIQQTIVENNLACNNVARTPITSTTNILEDNWVYGQWNDQYGDYNCYAYAIGQTEQLNPGELSGNSYTGIPEVATLAHYAKEDLWALGYTGAYASSVAYTSSGHRQVLRFRRGTFYDEDNLCMASDYHVMRSGTDGYWYHKPGRTNPLKYKYPTSTAAWVYEAYDGENYVRDEAITYSGETWYVVYTTPCEYEYEPCSSSQHILTCTICGDTEGSAMSCIYLNGFCKACGAQEYTHLTLNKLSANIQEE